MDLRVLVVCPDQNAATLLTTVLSEMEMAVEHTPSISRGLKLLDEQPFDAIVLDYRADHASEKFPACLRQSARNRTTMLIAVVDGEFNARPLFRLGANFVLYRPLSAERTRLSMHAARGLMRRERRRSPRTRVNSPATVSYAGAPDFSATLIDINDGGALITTRNRLPSAGKVYFEFAPPGQGQLVRLAGDVVWQDSSGRAGIRFLNVPRASRRLIQAWLQRNGAQPDPGSQAQSALIANQSGPNRQAGEHKDRGRFSNAGNRRGEERLACKIGAEVYLIGTSIPNRCTLSDISEGGCYIEMPSPFAGRPAVEILIRTSDMKFKIMGQVLTTHPGFGMGVRFLFRDSAEREEVLRLLAVLSAGPVLDEQPR